MCVYLVAQDMENISEDDGWEFVNLGDQQSFGIKTAGLEEKATACQMLVSSPVRCRSRALKRKNVLPTVRVPGVSEADLAEHKKFRSLLVFQLC